MMMRHAVSALLFLTPSVAAAQFIRVEPATVSVNAQGPTTAILTFSGLEGYTPAEGLWCARLVEAADRGVRCDPETIYGQAFGGVAGALPSGSVFTDVMSVPASVAQRAYEAALTGGAARFFYVRRFVGAGSAAGGAGPDQYVVVSCILGGGGANAPFTLTNVRLRLAAEMPVLFVRRGERPPAVSAEIAYTGSGRLRGRWEVVLPGDESPSPRDLLTEGSLPPAERGLRRRYLEIERFNVLLLPTGRFTLPGPDPARLPTSVDGAYMILLRVEVSDDGYGDTRIETAGGQVVVRNGAAAGFPMPTLRYYVGDSRTRSGVSSALPVRLRLPLPGALLPPDSALTLTWVVELGAGRHRVEIEGIADGKSVLSAIIPEGVDAYDAPPFMLARVPDGRVRWRVVSLDAAGSEVGHSEWRRAQRRPSP
jgi:hypothetical protein